MLVAWGLYARQLRLVEALEQVALKQETKRLKQELPPEVYDQDVKGTFWPLRKNHQDLDEEERIRLRRLFQ